VEGVGWIIEGESGKETGELLQGYLLSVCVRLSLAEALRRLAEGIRPTVIFYEGFPGKRTSSDIFRIKEFFPEAVVFLITAWNKPEEMNRRVSDALLETLRPSFPPIRNENTYQLTDREFEILKCMVSGLIKKEIAEQLSISYHTVDNHQRNIFRKLNVHTRSAAVAKALIEKLC
jgi:DNA-binding CsgD family transcriptional regulator